MLKVGVTGDIGSGKTIVCRIFEHLGVNVYYSDKEAKKFYNQQDVKNKLYPIFGAEIFTQTQNIDTLKLAKIVFSNSDLLQKLNKIIHPLVMEDFEQWCKNQKNCAYILFESAIIYSCKLTHYFDEIVFINAPFPLIIERVMQRDKLDFEAVKKRLSMQFPANKDFIKKDHIIYNDDERLVVPQVIDIHKDIISHHSVLQSGYIEEKK